MKVGENILEIPAGLGQVINVDKSVTPATRAIIIRNRQGATTVLKTGYLIK